MPDTAAGILGWVIPAVVVFGVTAIAIAVIAWAIRSARRSPRARAAADALRAKAGGVLVQLDDAVDELDLEVGLSGALYGGGAPTSLRRARLTAQHVRDDSFDEYRAICEPDAAPADIRRVSARIERRSTEALAVIAAARAEHADWVRANVSARDRSTRRAPDWLPSARAWAIRGPSSPSFRPLCRGGVVDADARAERRTPTSAEGAGPRRPRRRRTATTPPPPATAPSEMRPRRSSSRSRNIAQLYAAAHDTPRVGLRRGDDRPSRRRRAAPVHSACADLLSIDASRAAPGRSADRPHRAAPRPTLDRRRAHAQRAAPPHAASPEPSPQRATPSPRQSALTHAPGADARARLASAQRASSGARQRGTPSRRWMPPGGRCATRKTPGPSPTSTGWADADATAAPRIRIPRRPRLGIRSPLS